MNEIINQSNWPDFLKFYSAKNAGRPTRLGIFELENGVTNDFWLEDGLPLVAVDFCSKGEHSAINIMLEKYTHSVDEPAKLSLVLVEDQTDEGLDITDLEGRTTMLRLEDAGFERIRPPGS